MQRGTRTGTISGVLPILLLALLLLIPQARADGPMLALRLTGGETAIYAVGDITRIGFEGEETLVVVTAGGSEAYATESIERIEFLFEFSGVEDPREAAGLIKAIHLFQSRPNPMTAGTQISFELPQAGRVDLSVYSADGRLVRTLLAEEREAGRHAIAWDGGDEAGRRAPGGVGHRQSDLLRGCVADTDGRGPGGRLHHGRRGGPLRAGRARGDPDAGLLPGSARGDEPGVPGGCAVGV